LTAVAAGRQTEREELLALLLQHGILRRSETQPVLSRDGTSARWMLDSLPVTLSPRGAALAGRLLLDRLRKFDGRQLATFGLTAVPSFNRRSCNPADDITGYWCGESARHMARKN